MALSKVIAGVVAAGCTSYFMNWCSLRGVDFEALGVSSELVKSTIIGSVSGTLVGLTPDSIVQDIIDLIVWVKTSVKRIKDACNARMQPPT